jgi:hypothetical protein
MDEPLFRISRSTDSHGHRVACGVASVTTFLSLLGALFASGVRAELTVVAAVSALVSAVAWHAILRPYEAEVVLREERLEWGAVGNTEGAVDRSDVGSFVFGTGVNRDVSYAVLDDGTKVEIGMFGGEPNLRRLVAAVKRHWPEIPVDAKL